MNCDRIQVFGRTLVCASLVGAFLFSSVVGAEENAVGKVDDPTVMKPEPEADSPSAGVTNTKTLDGQANTKTENQAESGTAGSAAPPAPTGTAQNAAPHVAEQTTPPKKAKAVYSAPDPTGSTAELLAGIVGLAVALALALLLNIYLLRWRKILVEKAEENNQIVVPEIFWDTFEKQHTELMAQRAEIVNLRKALVTFAQRQQEMTKAQRAFIEGQMQELITNFIALQGPLSAAEDELQRYKEGYDHKVYKRFLERFISKVAMEVETEVNDPNEDSLAGIQFVLMDLLDEFDIERFEPDLDTDYRTVEGIADNPKELEATSADDEFTIVDILKPGYRLRSPDGPVVIVPARVSVRGAFSDPLKPQDVAADEESDSLALDGGIKESELPVQDTQVTENTDQQGAPEMEETKNG